MNVSCSAKSNACPILLSSACVFYEGENLLYTGINTNDTVQTALQKINNAFLTNILTIFVTPPLQTTGGVSPTLSIPKATGLVNGYLASTDWTIFNNKQNQLNGLGFVKASGTTITYDNSTYYLASNPNNFIPLTALSSTATGLTYTNTTGVFSLAPGYLIPTISSYNNVNWDTAYTNRITSLTTTGSSGAATLISNTLNVPNYTLSGLGGVPSSRQLTINGVAYDLSADRSWIISTDNIYTANGLLTNNRTLTLNGSNLDFVGSSFTNRFTSAGRLLIGTTAELTDILDVVGNAKIRGEFRIAVRPSVGGEQLISFTHNDVFNTINSLSFTYIQSAFALYLGAGNGQNVYLGYNNLNQLSSVGIGHTGSALAASAILDIKSTTKGFLAPRMTTAQINAIASPAEGLQVYNTTISHMCFYQAGAWQKISHSPM